MDISTPELWNHHMGQAEKLRTSNQLSGDQFGYHKSGHAFRKGDVVVPANDIYDAKKSLGRTVHPPHEPYIETGTPPGHENRGLSEGTYSISDPKKVYMAGDEHDTMTGNYGINSRTYKVKAKGVATPDKHFAGQDNASQIEVAGHLEVLHETKSSKMNRYTPSGHMHDEPMDETQRQANRQARNNPREREFQAAYSAHRDSSLQEMVKANLKASGRL